jgi:hypothetical protein
MNQVLNKYEFHNLHTFTEIYLKAARRLARNGQKDEARNWLRFFRNSNILQILARQADPDSVLPMDVPKLLTELSALESECHPLDRGDNATEISQLIASNKLLAFGIQEILLRLPKPPKLK